LWNSFVGTGIHNGPVPPANIMVKQEKREQPKEVLHLCRWSPHTHRGTRTQTDKHVEVVNVSFTDTKLAVTAIKVTHADLSTSEVKGTGSDISVSNGA
jgi:hypothetical protein